MGSEISKKDITRLGFRSSLLQASFNYERMQAGGFTWAMLPILKKIYKGVHRHRRGPFVHRAEE